MTTTENSSASLAEAQVRVLRDRVYCGVCSDTNWESCSPYWMSPDGTKQLLGFAAKDKITVPKAWEADGVLKMQRTVRKIKGLRGD